MNQICKEERDFLLDVEALTGRSIPNLDLKDISGSWEEWIPTEVDLLKELPKYLHDTMKSFLTDRFNQSIKKKRIGFIAREGHIKELYLKELKHIPESIGNLTHLEILQIDCYQLNSLPVSIGDLKSLKVLNLTGCTNLRTLPDSIGSLNSLEVLKISGLMKLLPDTLGNLKSLRILNFFGTSLLQYLPESIGDLESLEILTFIGNSNCSLGLRNIPIKKLPQSIGKLNSLKILNLSGCKSLEWIPEEICNLESLETLDLGEYDKDLISKTKNVHTIHSWNEIRSLNRRAFSLPENLGNLKNLRHLKLAFWKNLKKLPESLSQLDSLEVLDLSYCDSLNSLPETIGDLRSLIELNLKECISLKSIPKSIGKLRNTLKRIILRGCKLIGSLPETFENLHSLNMIDIRRCNFNKAPLSIIRLNKFKSLDLTGNPLNIEIDQISARVRSKIIDTLPLIPSSIFKKYLDNQISRKEVSNQLISLSKLSNSIFVKTRCIEFLEKVALRDEGIFDFLKDILLLKKHKFVRSAAVKTLINLFPIKCIEILQWIVQNVKSAEVLISLFTILDESESDINIALKAQILERYAEFYDTCIEEARFFLDLQAISMENEKAYYYNRDMDLEIGLIGNWCSGSLWTLKRDDGASHIAYAKSKDNHVIGIKLNYWQIDEIPESIRLLSKLRYLEGFNINRLPKSLNSLRKLRHLYITGKGLTYIPEIILSIAKKRYSLQYLHEGVVPSEAHVLGVLQIMGTYFDKLEEEENGHNFEFGSYYKINREGHITYLYISSESGGLGAFPDVLCSLEYLKELYLQYCDIQIIPECIGNLTSLKFLDLSYNSLQEIPVSIFSLKNLQYLILEGNPISPALLNEIGQTFITNYPLD